MATSIKLKGDIKKIEAAIKSKATPKTLVPKLEAQLDKLKSDLASLSSAKPKKGVTKTKVLSSLQKLKAKVKATKSLSGYKKSGIDIKKDADVPALPLGKRTAKTTGNTYYEYRLNRADVKQPPKRYPKLEDGGMMADKKFAVYAFDGKTNFFLDNQGDRSLVNYPSDIMSFDTTQEAIDFVKKHQHKYKYPLSWTENPNSKNLYAELNRDLEVYPISRMADGGMMANGGKISDKQMQRLDSGFQFIIYTDLPRQYGQYHISMAKEKGDVVYIVKSGHVADSKKVKTFTSEKDAFDYLTNKFGVKVSRKKMNYGDGGMMDENSEYASGGRLKSAVNRDRAYKSDEAWEQSYKRKSRPKNPKYDTSDKGIFEKGGYMAMGGALEHGLMVGDVVKRINGNVIDVYNEKTNDESVLDISNGKRVVRFPSRVNVQQNEFAQGGEMHRLFEDGEV